MTPQEITALLREAARLIERGKEATEAERETYRLRKVDLLERIAAFQGAGPSPDRRDVEVAVLATREAQTLRVGLPSVWGEV